MTTKRTLADYTPEELAAIEARKAASQEKYKVIREKCQKRSEKRKAFKARCVEGRTFLRDQFQEDDIDSAEAELTDGFSVSYVVVPDNSCDKAAGLQRYKGAFCVKVPTDIFKAGVALGLCGYRLKHNVEDYIFYCNVPEPALPAYAREIAGYVVAARLLQFGPGTPKRYMRSVQAACRRLLSQTKKARPLPLPPTPSDN